MLLGTIPIIACGPTFTGTDIMIFIITVIIILSIGMYGLVKMVQCKYKIFISIYLLCMIGLCFVQGEIAFLMLPFFGLLSLIKSSINKIRFL